MSARPDGRAGRGRGARRQALRAQLAQWFTGHFQTHDARSTAISRAEASVVVPHLAAQLLGLRRERLPLQSPLLRRSRRLGRPARFRRYQRFADHRHESLERVGAILLERTEALRVDDDQASAVMRRPAIRARRGRADGGSAVQAAESKRSSTAFDTLLTFCPPGPKRARRGPRSARRGSPATRRLRRHDAPSVVAGGCCFAHARFAISRRTSLCATGITTRAP